MGWIIGFEPTTSRATTWRSNQLSYIHHLLARLKGLEPLTYCLEGSCSIQLSYKRIFNFMERVMGIEPTQPAWKAGILAIELHPHILFSSPQESVTLTIIAEYPLFVNTFFNFFTTICIPAVFFRIRLRIPLKIISPFLPFYSLQTAKHPLLFSQKIHQIQRAHRPFFRYPMSGGQYRSSGIRHGL